MIKNKHMSVLHINKILFIKIREGQFWWGGWSQELEKDP